MPSSPTTPKIEPLQESKFVCQLQPSKDSRDSAKGRPRSQTFKVCAPDPFLPPDMHSNGICQAKRPPQIRTTPPLLVILIRGKTNTFERTLAWRGTWQAHITLILGSSTPIDHLHLHISYSYLPIRTCVKTFEAFQQFREYCE